MSGENDSSDNSGSDSGKASGTFDVELGKKLENGVEAGCFGVLAVCVCSDLTSGDWAIGLGMWVASIVMGGLALFAMTKQLGNAWAWMRRRIQSCLESAPDKLADAAAVVVLIVGPANLMAGAAVILALVAGRLPSLLQVPVLILVAVLATGLWRFGQHRDGEGEIPIAVKAAKPLIWFAGFLIVFPLTDVGWFGKFGDCMKQASANIEELIGIADKQSKRERAVKQIGQGFKDFIESL